MTYSFLRSGICVLTVALVFSACSSLPPAPKNAAQSSYEYKLGPGDKLEIIVWKNPELSTKVAVRPDGKVSAPLIDDLVAIGKSPTELGKEIEERISTFVRSPTVTVMVTDFVGASPEQVRVIGQAAKPTALPYKQRMTLLDVMIAVGGITEYAAGNRAVLIRSSENGKQYSLRLKDLLQNGDVSANADVLPGDVIMIPETFF